MESRSTNKLPLVVIVGPTASGKTGMAMMLAKKYGGEVICADSRTIYKGMDIGTAKPTVDERAEVAHWGLDLVEPNERFTAADFKRYAEQKVTEIRGRNHIPFLVGGTGLYVDSILFDYQFDTPGSEMLRKKLNDMTLGELQRYCEENNITLPENNKNKRYLVRAIEQNGINTKRQIKPVSNSVIVGITTDRDVLRARIAKRVEQIFNDGVVEEATILGKKYGWDGEAMTGIIYPLVHDYLEGRSTLEATKERFAIQDWHLAKRQLTWLRHNPFVKWLSLQEADKYVSDALAPHNKA